MIKYKYQLHFKEIIARETRDAKGTLRPLWKQPFTVERIQPLGIARAEFEPQYHFLAEGPWENTLSIKWN